MRGILRNFLFAAGGLGLFIFANNTNLFASREPGHPTLLAHRGIAQRYPTENLASDACTAAVTLPSSHAFLENTIPSLRASFEAGADINEFDVHPTTDGEFVVFHDWTLDCRTDGSGVTREHSMAELKKLDIGYGYTMDGGTTFPFRGEGVGLMPTLEEVLSTFPDKRFLINVKSRDMTEGEKLAAVLLGLPETQRSLLMVYGGHEPVMRMKELMPDLRVMSRETFKACLLRYIAYGWTGRMPEACRDTIILVPVNVAPWLWGWPDKFLNRFEAAGTQVYVMGAFHGGTFSTGFDTVEDIDRLPAGYSGGIWTNEIGLIAGRLKRPAD